MYSLMARLLLKMAGADLRSPKECDHTKFGGGHTFACFRGELTHVFICTQCGTVEREVYAEKPTEYVDRLSVN